MVVIARFLSSFLFKLFWYVFVVFFSLAFCTKFPRSSQKSRSGESWYKLDFLRKDLKAQFDFDRGWCRVRSSSHHDCQSRKGLLRFSISMLLKGSRYRKGLRRSGKVDSDGHAVCGLHDGQKLIYQLLFFSADGFHPFEFFAGSPELLKD